MYIGNVIQNMYPSENNTLNVLNFFNYNTICLLRKLQNNAIAMLNDIKVNKSFVVEIIS